MIYFSLLEKYGGCNSFYFNNNENIEFLDYQKMIIGMLVQNWPYINYNEN